MSDNQVSGRDGAGVEGGSQRKTRRNLTIGLAVILVVLLVVFGLLWMFRSGQNSGARQSSALTTSDSTVTGESSGSSKDSSVQSPQSETSTSAGEATPNPLSLTEVTATGRTECLSDTESAAGTPALNLACPSNTRGSSEATFPLGGSYQSLTGKLESDLQTAVTVKITPEGASQQPTQISVGAGETVDVNVPLNGAQTVKLVIVPDRDQWSGTGLVFSNAQVQ